MGEETDLNEIVFGKLSKAIALAIMQRIGDLSKAKSDFKVGNDESDLALQAYIALGTRFFDTAGIMPKSPVDAWPDIPPGSLSVDAEFRDFDHEVEPQVVS